MSNIKAICYLHRHGDDRNKCVLTDADLVIYIRGIKKSFPHEMLLKAVFHEKKLLLPLISGGIIASLGLVANFSGYFNSWVTITIAIIGLYLFYYGWMGTWTLSISTTLGNNDIYLKGVSRNLRAFVNYLNNFLIDIKSDEKKFSNFYLLIPAKDWERASANRSALNKEKKKTKLFTYEQIAILRFHIKKDQIILSINPDFIQQEIKFEADQGSGQLYPFIYDQIPYESFQKNFNST